MNRQKSRQIIIFIIGFILIGTASILFGYFMVNVNRTDKIIDLCYLENKNSPRLLIAYQCTNYNEDDGQHLSGYNIVYLHPKTKEIIDEVFISRYKSGTPPKPNLYKVNSNEFWLIQKNEFIQGDTGFIQHFEIRNEKIKLLDRKPTHGYSPIEYNGNSSVLMSNRFNEKFCFNLLDKKITEGTCPFISEGYDTIKTAFILVNKSEGSSRHYLYYYSTTSPDPMQVSSGSNQQQSLLYKLWFSRNHIVQTEFDVYRKDSSATHKFKEIYTKDYLVNPGFLLQNELCAVLYEFDRENKKAKFFCFDNTGKKLWELNDDRFFYQDYSIDMKCKITNGLTIISCDLWILAMNNSTGKKEFDFFP